MQPLLIMSFYVIFFLLRDEEDIISSNGKIQKTIFANKDLLYPILQTTLGIAIGMLGQSNFKRIYAIFRNIFSIFSDSQFQ